MSSPSHANLTRSGSKPSHPQGTRIINELETKVFNKQIIANSEWTSLILKAGDKVCQTCFNSLPNLIEAWFDAQEIPVESPDVENLNHTSFDEQLEKNSAKEQLNAVFQLLNMEKIRDE